MHLAVIVALQWQGNSWCLHASMTHAWEDMVRPASYVFGATDHDSRPHIGLLLIQQHDVFFVIHASDLASG